MTQKELDNYYINVAELCSQNSKAIRLKVGAVLVKDQQIISDGFNGTPSGFENECETCKHIETCKNDCSCCNNKELITKPYVIHAESNCLMKSLKNGNSTDGATIYVTHAPCVECSKQIIQSGVKRVVYKNLYKTLDSVNLIIRANINVERIK